MKKIAVVALILTLAAGTTTWVAAREHGGHPGPHDGRPPHGHGEHLVPHHLFPPEAVLKNQMNLDLSDEQLQSIKKLLNETHARVLDVQMELHRATEALNRALEPSEVDESAVLAAAEEAMGLEKQVKKAHLELMVRIKNLLTADQQAKLKEILPPPPQKR